jgi:predicted metalloprotease with PDZ domain
MIRYAIDASATPSHTFAVTLTVPGPASAQQLSLPVWIPGSYLVREFARHLSGVSAEQGGQVVSIRQLDKASWMAACDGEAELVVRYCVYAFDVSVRAAYLDGTRGFFNGTGVCLRVEGREGEAHALALTGLPPGWEVATTLATHGDLAGREFVAPDYDALVDHPVELGRFWRGRFDAAGIAHEFAVAGALPDFDGERLLADTRKICEAEIAFWHGASGKPPFERYLFLLNAVDEGHGGLEHRSSTALVAPRRELPRQPEKNERAAVAPPSETSEGYAGVLGLIAHEYFHAWNVKRLKPRDFAPLDYARENYTELLWFFEGFTSYYDDLFVVRSGRIDAARYLKLLGKTITAVAATPGREAQSVAAASFDAWVKYYRQDENTPNATVSYYAKGSLVALALDLTLRHEGRGTLDDVMRRLWSQSDGAAALEAVGGRSYAPEIAAWVHGTDELPLESLLRRFAVEFDRQPATLAQRLGIRVGESPLTGVKVTHVLRGGAGEAIGLAPGDELIAAGGWRLRRLDDALRGLPTNGEMTLVVARDQRVFNLVLEAGNLAGASAGAVQLRRTESAGVEARALCEAWIAG